LRAFAECESYNLTRTNCFDKLPNQSIAKRTSTAASSKSIRMLENQRKLEDTFHSKHGSE